MCIRDRADVQRAMNSYNAPDEVNRVDWNQVTLKKELVDKIAKLIERKKTVAEFSYRSYADIYDNLYVTKADFASGIVELHISGKLDETLVFDLSLIHIFLSVTDFADERFKKKSVLALFDDKDNHIMDVEIASHRKHKNFDRCV